MFGRQTHCKSILGSLQWYQNGRPGTPIDQAKNQWNINILPKIKVEGTIYNETI